MNAGVFNPGELVALLRPFIGSWLLDNPMRLAFTLTCGTELTGARLRDVTLAGVSLEGGMTIGWGEISRVQLHEPGTRFTYDVGDT